MSVKIRLKRERLGALEGRVHESVEELDARGGRESADLEREHLVAEASVAPVSENGGLRHEEHKVPAQRRHQGPLGGVCWGGSHLGHVVKDCQQGSLQAGEEQVRTDLPWDLEEPSEPSDRAMLSVVDRRMGDDIIVDDRTQGKPCRELVDARAAVAVIRPGIVEGLMSREPNRSYRLVTASGDALPLEKVALWELTLGRTVGGLWVFVERVAAEVTLSALGSHEATSDVDKRVLRVGGNERTLQSPSEHLGVSRVTLVEAAVGPFKNEVAEVCQRGRQSWNTPDRLGVRRAARRHTWRKDNRPRIRHTRRAYCRSNQDGAHRYTRIKGCYPAAIPRIVPPGEEVRWRGLRVRRIRLVGTTSPEEGAVSRRPRSRKAANRDLGGRAKN